ncbi:MAG TPA: oligopeptide/dipeptide ABC transporter ATP-binding protein [Jatrophihabitans sp.]|jgi:oligopeptide/dipeptide ABC transporter ATP-binding protein|uniref:ABC transporter ATP-binding protein n=1 Tax=Jatrophihabitans sp. TaxID=1932789 RepID=UPI002DF90487|nr:oligopeptide/dipeptide ABC transporter ATP-binding protein [Jatrophihabitans sp.]
MSDHAPVTPSTPKTSSAPLLEVENLQKHFKQYSQTLIKRAAPPVKAVDGISFALEAGQTLGLVGESGCGKSTAGRTMLRLIEPTGGAIRFNGEDVTKFGTSQLRRMRREMQMVFQDPIGSLNPRHPVGSIIGAPFRIQGVKPPKGVRSEVQSIMERVGLNPEHYNRYPHEFSGGQRQRIGIARAIALQPQLIVCDEPVSALDVSIQAQVVNLLEDLQEEYKIAYVFIAHDLSVVRHISDRVAVMYLGKMMELTDRDVLYATPMHPYTQALMSAVPVPDPDRAEARERIMLSGDLPSPNDPPPGCVFHTRCPKYREQLSDNQREECRTTIPLLEEKQPGHFAACHFAEVRVDSAVTVAAPVAPVAEPQAGGAAGPAEGSGPSLTKS